MYSVDRCWGVADRVDHDEIAEASEVVLPFDAVGYIHQVVDHVEVAILEDLVGLEDMDDVVQDQVHQGEVAH